MSVQEYGSQPRIVAGVDGSDSSLSALRWAVRQAGLTGAAVDAVAAWHYPVAAGGFGYVPMGTGEDYDFKEITEKALADAISSTVDPGSGVRVRGHVIEGNAAQVLLDASDGADLLVLGSRGHGGFAEALLGSVSQHCVHHARCPVLVIRGDLNPERTSAGRFQFGFEPLGELAPLVGAQAVPGHPAQEGAAAFGVPQGRIAGQLGGNHRPGQPGSTARPRTRPRLDVDGPDRRRRPEGRPGRTDGRAGPGAAARH